MITRCLLATAAALAPAVAAYAEDLRVPRWVVAAHCTRAGVDARAGVVGVREGVVTAGDA